MRKIPSRIEEVSIKKKKKSNAPIENEWMVGITTPLPNEKALIPFIISKFEKILPKEDLNFFLNKRSLSIFRRAFTHQDRDAEINYEQLEFYGDICVKKAFADYLVLKFPFVNNEATFSTLVSHFLGESAFHPFSEIWGLYDLLDKPVDFPITNKDKEDIFESFIGATAYLADKISLGLSARVVYELTLPLFKSLDIDPNNARQFEPATTTLKQGFDTFFKNKDNQARDVVYVKTEYPRNEEQKEDIFEFKVYKYKDKNGPHELLGIGRNRRKQDAKEEASKRALLKLGWTPDIIDEERDRIERLKHKESLDYLAKTLNRNAKDYKFEVQIYKGSGKARVTLYYKNKYVKSTVANIARLKGAYKNLAARHIKEEEQNNALSEQYGKKVASKTTTVNKIKTKPRSHSFS